MADAELMKRVLNLLRLCYPNKREPPLCILLRGRDFHVFSESPGPCRWAESLDDALRQFARHLEGELELMLEENEEHNQKIREAIEADG